VATGPHHQFLIKCWEPELWCCCNPVRDMDPSGSAELCMFYVDLCPAALRRGVCDAENIFGVGEK